MQEFKRTSYSFQAIPQPQPQPEPYPQPQPQPNIAPTPPGPPSLSPGLLGSSSSSSY